MNILLSVDHVQDMYIFCVQPQVIPPVANHFQKLKLTKIIHVKRFSACKLVVSFSNTKQQYFDIYTSSKYERVLRVSLDCHAERPN